MKKLKTKSLFNIILAIITIIAIARFFYYNSKNFTSTLNYNDTTFIGNIIKISGDKITIKVNNEYLIGNYQEDNRFQLNDKVKFTGKLSKPLKSTMFNGFNYREYLYYNKTYFTINISNIEIIEKNSNILYKIKNHLIKRVKKYKSYPYLNAFILGDTKDIDSTVRESFRINNISHLFAVSGMHIGLFTSIIMKIGNKIVKRDNIIFIIILLFLFVYTFLVNYSPSVVRGSLFLILNRVNQKFMLKIKPCALLYFIMLMLIIINPFYLYHLGFIYSFIISFCLILLNEYLNKDKNYIVTLLKISVISFIASSFITIYNNYELNLLGIFYNLIFVPFISFIIFPLSIVNILINVDFIYLKLINLLEILSLFLSKIDFLKITTGKPNFIELMILILFTIFILYKIRKTEKVRFIILFFIFIFLYSNSNHIIKNDYLTMLDVNQGDAIFLNISNKSILIDTGGSYYTSYADKISDYLKSMGIKKLDYLILSHGDFDHMGDAKNLIEVFKVKNVVFNCGDYNNLEKELIMILKRKKIKYYTCINEIDLNKYKLQFLNTKIYDNENDNSNVIYFNYNNIKFLFMGDAGIEKEEDILDKYNISDVDILKIGHHGSRTSSSKNFIDEIKPKYSLISVGKNNHYGHPNNNVLDNLKDSKIYRTDNDGSIMFKIKKNKLKIETCQP